jgi:hypothetical protein
MKEGMGFAIVLACCLSCGSCQGRHRPEYLVLEKGPYRLFFYGAVHSNDIRDPMFNDIDSQFTGHRPNFVLVEGGYDERHYKTREKAAKEGEAAYVSFLARKAGCLVGSIEPPDSLVIEKLKQKYDESSILTMYLLRQIFQLQREAKHREIEFEGYTVNFARSYAKIGNFEAYIGTFPDVQNLIFDETKLKITKDNWKLANVFDVVYKPPGKIHAIYKEVLKARDEYAAGLILKKLAEHKRVFVIMGGDHIKSQKHKLEKEFQMLNKR